MLFGKLTERTCTEPAAGCTWPTAQRPTRVDSSSTNSTTIRPPSTPIAPHPTSNSTSRVGFCPSSKAARRSSISHFHRRRNGQRCRTAPRSVGSSLPGREGALLLGIPSLTFATSARLFESGGPRARRRRAAAVGKHDDLCARQPRAYRLCLADRTLKFQQGYADQVADSVGR